MPSIYSKQIIRVNSKKPQKQINFIKKLALIKSKYCMQTKKSIKTSNRKIRKNKKNHKKEHIKKRVKKKIGSVDLPRTLITKHKKTRSKSNRLGTRICRLENVIQKSKKMLNIQIDYISQRLFRTQTDLITHIFQSNELDLGHQKGFGKKKTILKNFANQNTLSSSNNFENWSIKEVINNISLSDNSQSIANRKEISFNGISSGFFS